ANRPERERTPSSLGCVAAPIFSGLCSVAHRRRRHRHRRTGPGAEAPSPPRQLHRRPPDRPSAQGHDLRSGFERVTPVSRGPSSGSPPPGHPCGHPRVQLPVPNLVLTGPALYGGAREPSRGFRVSVTFGLVTPMEISEERFEDMVADALESIPAELTDQLENVAVI